MTIYEVDHKVFKYNEIHERISYQRLGLWNSTECVCLPYIRLVDKQPYRFKFSNGVFHNRGWTIPMKTY